MKKKLVLIFAVYFLASSIQAQEEYTRPSQLGISFFLNDYTTASRIRASSLSSVLRDKKWAKPGDMNPGIAVHYFKGIRPHIDFAGTLGFSGDENALPDNSNNSGSGLLLEADASVNLKMFTDRYWFQPYLTAGVGGQKYKKSYGAFVPLGVGMKVNFFNEADVVISTQYRLPITTETARYRFFYSFGVAGNIGKRKEPKVIAPPPPPPPVDTDGDGITDDKDKCPTVPGVAKYDGCPVPDTDKDGINDDNDKCPDVPGIARYNGCPVPDTDKDGINDEDDKCKDTPGVARYEGCPVPDTDGDGINDEEDKCPTIPGVASQNGCPEISQEVMKKVEYAAKNIYFSTGSAKLQSKSFKPLNEVVKIMQENKDLLLDISGHTDNTGVATKNMALSQVRADAVKAYMVSKGIDAGRLTATGYGQEKPVADNKTAAGRQLNRRVELKISY
ncbi:MAG: OmpA family protein [Terrimonas sp.]|nr:OmpA family protein [Terrimonas sp.]